MGGGQGQGLCGEVWGGAWGKGAWGGAGLGGRGQEAGLGPGAGPGGPGGPGHWAAAGL